MSQQIEFPEVSEFLQKMQIRKSMFGYDKEDVMVKMHQLNRLYQDRMLMVKGQLEQEHLAVKEERERMRVEAERVQKEMEENRQALVEQIRKEEREKLLASMEEKRLEHQNELRMLGEELNRAGEQLKNLRGHVQQMTAEFEK